MAVFIPFKGVRYNTGDPDLSKYVCPPFDVISAEQREKLIGGNPGNIVEVELPAGGADRYSKAAANLERMMSSGLLKADDTECFYVIRTLFSIDGIPAAIESVTGRLKLEPFGGAVLPHENTRSADKSDRLELMKATAANISPIYILADDPENILRSIIRETTEKNPAATASYEGEVHSVYPVSGASATEITGFFSGRPVFIADGHHRYETGLAYKEYRESLGEVVSDAHPAGYIMASCVAAQHPGLVIMPTHRVVLRRGGFNSGALLSACGDEFDVQRVKRDRAKRELDDCYKSGDIAFLYYDGEYALIRKTLETGLPGADDPLSRLDLSALHSSILTKHLGIGETDMAKGKGLFFTRDSGEAAAMVDSGKADCAFIVNPTRVTDIMAVALAGERMPQKSTYFYPKMLTGTVLNKM